MILKTCTRCGAEKPLAGFYKCGKGTRYPGDGYRSHCKSCMAVAQAALYTPEQKRAMTRETARKARAANPRKFWLRRLEAHGINEMQYTALLDKQGGGCAICGVKECDSGSRFSIDHDHACCVGNFSCGKCVRGLLCRKCNGAIGLLRDSPALARAAAQYLSKNKRRGGCPSRRLPLGETKPFRCLPLAASSA